MQLTLAERLALRNQLMTMKALKVPDYSAAQYDEMIQIVDGGYEVFYPDLLSGMSESGIDSAVTAEVLDILNLYRALDAAKQNGIVLPTKGYTSFAGFDANNDDHYGFSVFVLDVQGKYTESAPSKNSHTSGTLSAYRRMLSAWQGLGKPYSLSQTAVDSIFA